MTAGRAELRVNRNCSRTTGVVFNVRQVTGQSYLARSFFPSSSSVMHHPQCNGTNNGDLSLTSLDKSGALAVSLSNVPGMLRQGRAACTRIGSVRRRLMGLS